jgi:hypothetical protein
MPGGKMCVIIGVPALQHRSPPRFSSGCASADHRSPGTIWRCHGELDHAAKRRPDARQFSSKEANTAFDVGRLGTSCWLRVIS